MPHKRNPVLTENLTGLARMVRSAVTPAMEDVALWHERDISHSSVERMIGPDATITLDFALARLADVDRQARRLSRDHAQEPRPARRPHSFAARAAGADAKGRLARRRLCARAAQRDAGLARREASFWTSLKADGDVAKALERGGARGAVRPWLSLEARRYDFRARVRGVGEPLKREMGSPPLPLAGEGWGEGKRVLFQATERRTTRCSDSLGRFNVGPGKIIAFEKQPLRPCGR